MGDADAHEQDRKAAEQGPCEKLSHIFLLHAVEAEMTAYSINVPGSPSPYRKRKRHDDFDTPAIRIT
ncbi:hypothetical protein [Dyella ginsengisoli]|uniref:hypothetical protein n=1 Tax=Dyella ginsengisoli TaxID=363848 RepID=UPI0012FDB5DB|nr:hypothetical protein [Dyella ginsengisoli]